MKTLFIAFLALVIGFCVGVGVMRPALRQLRAEVATKDSELAQRKTEEDLALKELKECSAIVKAQNDQLRQNNQMLADWIHRKRVQ